MYDIWYCYFNRYIRYSLWWGWSLTVPFSLINNFFLLTFIKFFFIIPLILIGLLAFLIPHKKSYDKNIAFECGFTTFENKFFGFNTQYFFMILIFIFFDLEILLIIPYLTINTYWSYNMVAGLILLLLIFILILLLEFTTNCLIFYNYNILNSSQIKKRLLKRILI